MRYSFIEAKSNHRQRYFKRNPVRVARLFLCLLFSLIVLFSSPMALASVIGRVVKPYGNYTFTADDNMLRIRDKADPLPLLGTTNLFDISHRLTGGAMLEKRISRQLFSANANFTHTRYERFSQINNDLKSFSGNWNWFLGNRLEGNMGASYMQSLAPFLFQPGLKNIRTEQTAFFNGAWRFHPSWRLTGDYLRYELDTGGSDGIFRFLNRIEDRFEGGIDYITAHRNTFGVDFRYTIGDFPVLVRAPDGSARDNSYDQKEVMSRAVWAITGKSNFNWRGGWVERTNASFPERDFSGFNARLAYQWQPTEKIGLTINGWRETSAMQVLTASFGLNTGVSVVPSWNISRKVRLEGDFSYETRKFNSFVLLTDSLLPVGTDNTIRNATMRLIYVPYRGLQLTATAYHNDLKTDNALGGFNANGATLGLQYTYGRP